jgi:hypothetical protein
MILSKAHFVDIALHIFYTVMMMRANPLALNQDPEILDIVCVNSVSDAELAQ